VLDGFLATKDLGAIGLLVERAAVAEAEGGVSEEWSEGSFEPSRQPFVIGIQEGDEIPFGLLNAAVAGGGGAGVLLADVADRPLDRLDGAFDEGRAVVSGDDDGDGLSKRVCIQV
jgi:hypothetical protein